jgi:hypothetical protein
LGLFWLQPNPKVLQNPGEHLGVVLGILLLSLPLLLTSAAYAWWIRRGIILMDEEKLVWQGLGRLHATRWNEVNDYFIQSVNGSRRYIIQTSAGKLALGSEWTNLPTATAWVEQQATAARARQWEEQATRSDLPWPREFHYQTFENKFMPWLVLAVGCGYPFMILVGKGKSLQTIQDIYQLYGWPLTALMVVTVLAAALLMPLLLGVMHGSLWKATRARYNQRIVCTPETITWTNDTQGITAQWDEVTDYYREALPGRIQFIQRFVVETTHGSFDWVPSLHRRPLLQSTVQQHATSAHAKQWQLRDQSTLDDSLKLPEGVECLDAGSKHFRYGYRTSTIRALLWLPTFVLVTPLIGLQGSQLSRLPDEVETSITAPAVDDISPTYSALSILGIISAMSAVGWMWWRYRTAAVETDAHGITQLTPFGRRFIAWGEVLISGSDMLTFGNVEGRNEQGESQRVRFHLLIGGSDELKAHIEQRATNALSRRWETD